jgi:hypothetical protein
LNSELIKQKAIHIGALFDSFVERGAVAVAGAGRGAQQDRVIRATRRLQGEFSKNEPRPKPRFLIL